MLDLSPQIVEVMGAFRRLTRFTSTCLCLFLLSLAQHLMQKSFFSRHHGPFPLCSDSLARACRPRAARRLAQYRRGEEPCGPASVGPAAAWVRGSPRASRGFGLAPLAAPEALCICLMPRDAPSENQGD